MKEENEEESTKNARGAFILLVVVSIVVTPGNMSQYLTDFIISVYLSEAKRGTTHDFKSFRSIGTSVQRRQTMKEFEDRPADSSSVQQSKCFKKTHLSESDPLHREPTNLVYV